MFGANKTSSISAPNSISLPKNSVISGHLPSRWWASLTWVGSTEFKGVVKRDWIPTGRIDFATKQSNADADQPSEFRLLVEERRIIESIAGNENLEIQWRPATLKEAKFVTTHYHKYLAENSLIK